MRPSIIAAMQRVEATADAEAARRTATLLRARGEVAAEAAVLTLAAELDP